MADDNTVPVRSAVHVLRRNDPAITSVTIFLDRELNTDRELANALSENEHVTIAEIIFQYDSRAAAPPLPAHRWSRLRHVLATKRLEAIKCCGRYYRRADRRELPQHVSLMPEEVRKLFFDAIQQNSSIQRVALFGLPLPGAETAEILGDIASMTHLALIDCTIMAIDTSESDSDEERSSGEEGAQAIANALRRNENLEHFALDFGEPCMLPIVQSFASNKKHLRSFHVVPRRGAHSDTSVAFFEATSRCQYVESLQILVNNDSCLQVVLQAIPQLRMRRVQIIINEDSDITTEQSLPRLLGAIKRNFNLFSVEIKSTTGNVFSNQNATNEAISVDANTEDRQLWRYLRRNKLLADWTRNPELLPKNLWPEALAIASQAGAELFWQSPQYYDRPHESLRVFHKP